VSHKKQARTKWRIGGGGNRGRTPAKSFEIARTKEVVPQWLHGAMSHDEITAFKEVIRREQFNSDDMEFFSDIILMDAGISKSITRAKMLRKIKDHFNE